MKFYIDLFISVNYNLTPLFYRFYDYLLIGICRIFYWFKIFGFRYHVDYKFLFEKGGENKQRGKFLNNKVNFFDVMQFGCANLLTHL